VTATPPEVRALLDHDPFARRLLTSRIPARMAYVALDGTPRAIPIGYLYTEGRFVMATAEGAPKVAALRADPTVALTIDTETQPPVVLLVRGTVELELVDGVPDDYLEASRKAFGEEEFAAFREGVTALYDRMWTITLTPTWAKVLDFETRIPDTVQRLVDAKAGNAPQG
jgi:nitroimidazol reductase NimA-like FMN-containing flavoprotein (pyridoxamine 5'-phosphate oxidase superfamily)